MVEVSVGEDERVDARRIEAQRDAIADRLVGTPLEHAAVDEDPGSSRGHQEP